MFCRDNEEIKDKAMKNPELTLIGMDPKMILAKHQNDFQQYMLRNLSLDELRAIRASLPKFRGDQKVHFFSFLIQIQNINLYNKTETN